MGVQARLGQPAEPESIFPSVASSSEPRQGPTSSAASRKSRMSAGAAKRKPRNPAPVIPEAQVTA